MARAPSTVLAEWYVLETPKEFTSQAPTGNLPLPSTIQIISSYFNSTPIRSVVWMLVFGASTHTAGSRPPAVAVLAAARTCILKPVPTGIHALHRTTGIVALTGPSANDNLLLRCWWECVPGGLTTLQTFPGEQSSCNRAVTQTPARLTHFLHTQQPASNCGWERKARTIGGKQRGMRLGGIPQ